MTVAAQVPVAAGSVMLAGQAIAGACVSVTVTVKLQLNVLAGVAASLAVQVTWWAPTLKLLPLAGAHTTVTAPAQLSVATGVS